MDPVKLARDLDVEFRNCCAAIDRDEPWFGHFTIQCGDKPRSYKVGAARRPDQRIVDWRHPLAEAYYDLEPGERFELDGTGYARIEGDVTCRAVVASKARSLRRVALRTIEGEAIALATDDSFALADDQRAVMEPETGLPNILGLLTPEQYRLITASRDKPVIIQGRAGSGKTTVALYRVSWLTHPIEGSDAVPVDPSKVLIVMFNRALSTFVRDSLEPLKLEAAELDTFHAWALREIRKAYRGVIEPDTTEREGKNTAEALKKQLGILKAVDAFVVRQTERLDAWLAEKLGPYGGDAQLARFRALPLPVVRRLVTMRTESRTARDGAAGAERDRLEQIYRVFDKAVIRMTQYKDELVKLLTDQALLGEYLPHVPPADLDALATYQRALQRDRASARRPGPFVAFEDFALILRLIQLKNGGFPDKDQDDEVTIFDHLVVDEAQDFGAVEMTVLLSSVRSRTGVTIVGDMNQKIIPQADFIGWDALAGELGVDGASVTKLEVAHRSTLPIMRLADSIVGDDSSSGRPGATPSLTLVDSAEAKHAAIVEAIRGRVADSHSAHICVICDRPRTARELHAELEKSLEDLDTPIRYGHRNSFEFAPGVTITNMHQIKGLEFDAVIVVDPNTGRYPDNDQGRRYLYTVATRAKEWLDFICEGEPSPLLMRAVDAGLVDTVGHAAVAPVEFTDEDDEPF